MPRLLLAILTISFLFTTAPGFAGMTKDACIKNCEQKCAGVPSPGKCNSQCTTRNCNKM